MEDEIQYFSVTRPHIMRSAQVKGGSPVIIGTNVRVLDVYAALELIGMVPEDIARMYNLSLVQVYAALTFAYEHRDFFDRAVNHL
jgi:uncharacterized protein (DUF433 family)